MKPLVDFGGVFLEEEDMFLPPVVAVSLKERGRPFP